MPPPGPGTGMVQKFRTPADKPTTMLKLVSLKNKAILADANMTPKHMDTRHKKGVNVFYANGGAKWVPREAFAKPDSKFMTQTVQTAAGLTPYKDLIASENGVFSGNNNTVYLDEILTQTGALKAEPKGLWIDYDKY